MTQGTRATGLAVLLLTFGAVIGSASALAEPAPEQARVAYWNHESYWNHEGTTK